MIYPQPLILIISLPHLGVDRPDLHELFHLLIGDFCPSLLMLCQQFLNDCCQFLFHLAREHYAFAVLFFDLLQASVVLQKEPQIMIWHVDAQISSFFLVLLLGHPTSRKRQLNLLCDLRLCIGEKDCTVWIASGHFLTIALEGRHELRVDARGFGDVQLVANVPSHPKVGILVNALRDQAEEVVVWKNVREGRGRARHCLDGRVVSFPTVVGIFKTEQSAHLRESNASLKFADVFVHGSHIVAVEEEEGLVQIETAGENILGIFEAEAAVIIKCVVCLLMEKFLVIAEHDDDRHLEGILEVLSEKERHQMAHMHAVRGGPSAGVDVEWLFVLVGSQEFVDVPVGEENVSAQEPMSWFSSKGLYFGNQFGRDFLATKLLNQLLIVNLFACFVYDDVGVDYYGVILILYLFLLGLLCVLIILLQHYQNFSCQRGNEGVNKLGTQLIRTLILSQRKLFTKLKSLARIVY